MSWFKGIRRRLGLVAPKMAVQTHVPWYWRWLVGLLLLTLLVGAVLKVYDQVQAGMSFGSETYQDYLRLKVLEPRTQQELETLRSRLVVAERQAQMDKATGAALSGQLKALQSTNASLREQVAFFEATLSAENKSRPLSVFRFAVAADGAPGAYRYRVLLMQASAKNTPFAGFFQLQAQVADASGKRELMFPMGQESDKTGYRINFQTHQRIERVLQLPAGAELLNLQLRVYEDGQPQPKIIENAKPSA